jgi:hypothetical protein
MAVVAFRCKRQPEKPLAWRRTQSEREKLAMGGWVGGAMEDGAAVIERKREGGLELGFQETIRRFRATHFYLFF